MASEIWAGFMRRLICMFAGVLLFILAFVSFSDAAGSNTFYASQFPGVTVADKVTRAQNECVRIFAGAQNCRVVIGVELASFANGTMPALCTKCTVEDWRSGTPYMTTAPVEVMYMSPTTTVSVPAATTAMGSGTNMWRRFDATVYTKFRITTTLNLVAPAGAKMRLQYSTDNTNFFDAEDTTTGGDLDLSFNGVIAGAWSPLKAAARNDVYWRFVLFGGDGTTRIVANTAIQFKP